MFLKFTEENITYRELIDEYRDLQMEINSDMIEFIDNLVVDGDKVVSGTILDYEECISLFDSIKVPSGMPLCNALEQIGKICKIYRIEDAESNDVDVTGGYLLDFIW